MSKIDNIYMIWYNTQYISLYGVILIKHLKNFVLILLLSSVLITFSSSCGVITTVEESFESEMSDISSDLPVRDTIYIGCSAFSGIFNPFYAETDSDKDVVRVTSVNLLTFDREGAIVYDAITGESVFHNDKEYIYYGISNISVNQKEDGSAVLSFQLRNDVKFSDSEILNVDDAIFSMYVLCDPSYDGASVFNTLPIVGLDDYINNRADQISGITKTGDYSFDVALIKYNPALISKFAITIAPMHYYGDSKLYNYDNNMFGFIKGNLDSVKSKTKPLGAGSYVFKNYSDGVIDFERNELYYLGTPKIKFLEFHETTDSEKLSGIANGKFDISDPDLNTSVIETILEINGGTLQGDVFHTYIFDHPGYGYIGICADTVKVGESKDSFESKSLRKAFATLFSIYRYNAVDSYYGNTANVIDYPISNTSWVSPKPNDEGYNIAYSLDVFGNPIYSDEMSESEKESAAMQAAVVYLKYAGFIYDEKVNKFISAPSGASLTYEVILPGNGIGDHPAYDIFLKTKAALAKIGITLNISDITDTDILWNSLDNGSCQIWAAAWSASAYPDLIQIYHSSNMDGFIGSTGSNDYDIADATLDELIISARNSNDPEHQKSIYKECFDIILDWGVEVPVYQRKNAVVINSYAVNIESISNEYTEFWNWIDDIHNIELNPVV